jgi:nucleotide-binding universal stress UspA family protein
MKILVGYDGSAVAKEAMKLAMEHAKVFGGKIYLVSSMLGGPEVPRKDFERAERELRRAETVLQEENMACETHFLVRGRSPGEDIVLFAEENHVDEIIIGVRRRSRVGKLLFGSNAQYIILQAPCPVVSVR